VRSSSRVRQLCSQDVVAPDPAPAPSRAEDKPPLWADDTPKWRPPIDDGLTEVQELEKAAEFAS